jgi:hypothetical protein
MGIAIVLVIGDILRVFTGHGVFLPDECWVWRMTARRRGQASLRRLEVTQTQTHAN